MAADHRTSERIVGLIASMPGCEIEDIVTLAQNLTWNQVFAEIDHLSRTGQVLVTLRGRGTYALSLPRDGRPEPYPRCDISPEVSETSSCHESSPQKRVA